MDIALKAEVCESLVDDPIWTELKKKDILTIIDIEERLQRQMSS